MTTAVTIQALLGEGADDATAITAPGAVPLTYKGLREQTAATIAAMAAIGVGRGDRVAIVLPNGPEMATAFLSIAAGAASAPLNPQYRADEFEFYLTDLGAKALVAEAGAPSAALEVAARLGIPVIGLKATPEQGAGRFVLDTGEAPKRGVAAGAAMQPAPRGTGVMSDSVATLTDADARPSLPVLTLQFRVF